MQWRSPAGKSSKNPVKKLFEIQLKLSQLTWLNKLQWLIFAGFWLISIQNQVSWMDFDWKSIKLTENPSKVKVFKLDFCFLENFHQVKIQSKSSKTVRSSQTQLDPVKHHHPPYWDLTGSNLHPVKIKLDPAKINHCDLLNQVN